MPDYDFHQLSPYDLEVLARDLLQEHWGVSLESFKTGKDGGIDLRLAKGPGHLIVQVKHFLRTGLRGLMRELGQEAEKVRKLRPRRYVLVTSVPLSPQNKAEIIAVLGSDVLAPGDVLGQDDLNNLLGQHPKIEGQHFKLWLASRAVLDRVLHNAETTKSEFKVRRVYEEARRYVPSDAYGRAMVMLNEQRVAVITGPPGVGKTTLADLLLYAHLQVGYQAVLVQRDIEEGLKLFEPGVPQIFYFDDFMGATFLGDKTGALLGSSDRALLDFVAMVKARPNARLVLTTREHIYSQAIERSERLRNSELDDLRVFLRMPDYSFNQRGRILYNHVYFSDLPDAYRDDLLRNDFYLEIIRHEKFNPRLIEWLSSYRRVRTIPVERYGAFIQNLLHDPSEIWRHAYEQEITDAGRTMLLCVFANGGKVGGQVLKASFNALHERRAKRYGFTTKPEDFRSALREVAGTFIKPWGAHGVEVIDPSVLDLMNAVVRNAPQNAADLVDGAPDFSQIEHVWSFAKDAKSGPVREELKTRANEFAPTMAATMMRDRRIQLDKGAVAYVGPAFESRLSLVIDMADNLSAPAIAALVPALFERLTKEWKTERPLVSETVELLRSLAGASSVSKHVADQMKAAVKAELLKEIRSGCRADELRETIGIIYSDDQDADEALDAAREAFAVYREGGFSEELRDCRSIEQFESLKEDLELFQDELGVDVKHLLSQLEEARTEFEDYEDQRADFLQDEWKEQRYERRDEDRSMTEMFGSLKGDRD